MILKSLENTQVLIVAAEASSCLYAQRLLECWQKNNQKISAFGVGNEKMKDLGFHCIGRSEEMALVGIQEICSQYFSILKVFRSLIKEAQKKKPKVALLLDYPDFNFRLIKKLKKMRVPIVYYISPQIWAWRKSRVHFIKKFVDKMVVIFPFEKAFYENYKVPVEFIGHPILDEVEPFYFKDDFITERRQRYGFKKNDIILGLMPGSRKSELKYMMKTQIETAKKLLEKHPNMKVAILMAPHLERKDFQKYIPENFPFCLTFVQDAPFKMLVLTDLVLAASGTATLFVGLMKKPFAVMYKMNPFSFKILSRLVKTKYITIVNILLDKNVVPEWIQDQANPDNLSKSLLQIIEDKKYRENMVSNLENLSENLKKDGATKRLVDILQTYLADKT